MKNTFKVFAICGLLVAPSASLRCMTLDALVAKATKEVAGKLEIDEIKKENKQLFKTAIKVTAALGVVTFILTNKNIGATLLATAIVPSFVVMMFSNTLTNALREAHQMPAGAKSIHCGMNRYFVIEN
jgi:hypothetical protein